MNTQCLSAARKRAIVLAAFSAALPLALPVPSVAATVPAGHHLIGPRYLWAFAPRPGAVSIQWGPDTPNGIYGVMGTYSVKCSSPAPRISSIHVHTYPHNLHSVGFIVRACGGNRNMGFMASWHTS